MDFNYEKIVPPQIEVPSAELPIRGIRGTASNEYLKKKLEAELRAAEAIGKLKQTIIEKRLAVELVSLEEEHKRKKSGTVYYSSSTGQPSKQHENPPPLEPRNLFKKTSLWPRKASNHKSPHRYDSFYKDARHEGHKGEVAYPMRAAVKESHKHMRNVMAKGGMPAYEPRASRMRRDSPYVHSAQPMDDDNDSLQEQGNEEEVAVADASQSLDNAPQVVPPEYQPRGKKSNFKQFFSKLRKNPGGGAPTG